MDNDRLLPDNYVNGNISGRLRLNQAQKTKKPPHKEIAFTVRVKDGSRTRDLRNHNPTL